MKRIQLDPNKLLGMQVIRDTASTGKRLRVPAGARNSVKAGMKAGVKLAPK
jgi:hypothetical protein